MMKMRRIAILVLFVFALPWCGWAKMSGNSVDLQKIWKSERFKKQFLGSYGFNANIEPEVSPTEAEQMKEVFGLMEEDPAGAAEQLEDIIAVAEESQETPSPIYDFYLANIYFQQDEMEKAVKYYLKAVDQFPSYRRAHKNLGLIYARTEKYKEAVESLTTTIKLGGGDGTVFGFLGVCHLNQKDFIAAEMAFRNALMFEPSNAQWNLGLTHSIFSQKRYAESASMMGELIKKDPSDPKFWLLQAQSYIAMGQMLKAADNFEIVTRMGKASPQTLDSLARIYVNEGMLDLAVVAYKKALKLNPNQDPGRALQVAENLTYRGAIDQAKELLSQIRSVSGSHLDEKQKKRVLKITSRIAMSEGRGDEAASVMEEVVTLDPLDGDALMMLARHYTRSNPEKAISYCQQAGRLEKFEADAKVREAQVLVSMRKYREAIPLLRQAQKIKPRDSVESYLQQLERLGK